MAARFVKHPLFSLFVASAMTLVACGGSDSGGSTAQSPSAAGETGDKAGVADTKVSRLAVAGSHIAVVARGALAANLGPVMQVRANGRLLGSVEVRAKTYRTYYFATSELLANGSRVEVSFVNDAVVGGADRNLYVQSITVDGRQIKPTDDGVTYDRGAVDGVDVVKGREDMLWNGSLRFPLSGGAGPKLGFSWATQNAWQEDFEGPAVLANWKFNPGAEFGKGAAGKVSLAPLPSGGKALELAYATPDCLGDGCPMYAAAVHKLEQPVRADNLRFRVRNNLTRESRVLAVVKDGAGQSFQYRPERCPFETSGDEWCTLDVDLRLPTAHWGGANDGAIRGDITEVSILVQALDGARGRVANKGTLQFDDVVLARAPSTVSLLRESAGTGGAGWRDANVDDNQARLGIAVHFTGNRSDDQDRLRKARDAGFGFVRTDLFWSRVEPTPGRYDFSAPEQLVADARAMDLKVLFILDYQNPFHKSGVLMSTDAERNAFAAYAAAAAARFKGQGVRFEIWNEQNTGADCPDGKEGFWLPRPDASNYGLLVAATMAAIRAVDADARVSLGGMTTSFTSSCDLTEPTQFSFQYLDALHRAGGLANVDALGYHPYYDMAEPWGAELNMLRGQLREKGFPGMQVWETEWGISSACPDGERPCAQGFSTSKRNRQAVRLARRMLVGLSLGLPVNVWYDLVDDGVDPNTRGDHFGLYDRQLNAKPALAAMKTLSEASKGRLSGVMPGLPAGLHALRFQKGADTVYAVWTERGSVALAVDPDGLVKSVDVQGRDIGIRGAWTLREADGPIYLTYR